MGQTIHNFCRQDLLMDVPEEKRLPPEPPEATPSNQSPNPESPKRVRFTFPTGPFYQGGFV